MTSPEVAECKVVSSAQGELIARFDEHGTVLPESPGEQMRLLYVLNIKCRYQEQLDGVAKASTPLRALKKAEESFNSTLSDIGGDMHSILPVVHQIGHVLRGRMLLCRGMLTRSEKIHDSGFANDAFWWGYSMDEISSPLTINDFKAVNPLKLLAPRLFTKNNPV